MTQPEALRLADELPWLADDDYAVATCKQAAAELRRLHAQRDALLEALRLIEHATAPTHDDGAYHEAAHDIACAAIAAVEGEKT